LTLSQGERSSKKGKSGETGRRGANSQVVRGEKKTHRVDDRATQGMVGKTLERKLVGDAADPIGGESAGSLSSRIPLQERR